MELIDWNEVLTAVVWGVGIVSGVCVLVLLAAIWRQRWSSPQLDQPLYKRSPEVSDEGE